MRCRWGYLRADPDVLPPYVASIHYATICRQTIGPSGHKCKYQTIVGGCYLRGRHAKKTSVESVSDTKFLVPSLARYHYNPRTVPTQSRLSCDHMRTSTHGDCDGSQPPSPGRMKACATHAREISRHPTLDTRHSTE